MQTGAYIARSRARNPFTVGSFTDPDVPNTLELKLKSAGTFIDKNYLGVPVNTNVAYPVNANIQPVVLVQE
jgi:hypothetical protein